LIKRTSLEHINLILKQNANWNILDIGCGYTAHPKATIICDVLNLADYYVGKKFIQLTEKKLPFKDNQFDFVISSHIIEHVEDVPFFISELERISKKGYIELPTKLEDNLVFENKTDHLWHTDFDDVNNKLIITKKIQIFEPILTVSSIQKLHKDFRKSLVLELMWQDKIDYQIQIDDKKQINKISILQLFRKYISKKIRMLLS